MPSRSPASASHVRRADSADVETVGSPTGSAMEAEADSEFGSAARKRARHVLYTAGTDRVDSLNTIFQLQWYIIAQVGMQIQLGKTNHRDANHRLMMDAYKQQVPGVARGFWKYMTHDRGGRRGNSWCNGHDLPWLEKRLMHKNGNFEPKNAVGGQYLWNQWTGPSGLRSQIQEEAWPAWQFVTANGSEVVMSGRDIIQTKDFLMQMWYEQSVRRNGTKDQTCAEIKQQSAQAWEKSPCSAHHDDARPKGECCVPRPGHGANCEIGQMPPQYKLPNAYLVMMCMGPIADHLRVHFEQFTNDEPHFPPFERCRQFDDLFAGLTISGQPPPPGDSSGAASTEQRPHLSRQSIRDAELEDDCNDDVGSMCSSLSAAARAVRTAVAAAGAKTTAADGVAMAQAQAGLLTARTELLKVVLSVKNDACTPAAQELLDDILAEVKADMHSSRKRRAEDDASGGSRS